MRALGEPRAIVVHHTAGPADRIGYHYVITSDGRIHRGRPLRYQGAHVAGGNRGAIAIALVGNYRTSTPNHAMLWALDRLVDALYTTLGAMFVYGHAEWAAAVGRPTQKTCPGAWWEGWADGNAAVYRHESS